MKRNQILVGDSLTLMQSLPDQSVNMIMTSSPYYGKRDYDHPGQLGQEATSEEFIEKLVAIFHESQRVLRDDGNLYVNLDDTYAHDSKWGGSMSRKARKDLHGTDASRKRKATGVPDKSLMLIPHRFAWAMIQDGWVCRSDNVWNKPNSMPASMKDRTTRSHEYVFHFVKAKRYFYDREAVLEPLSPNTPARMLRGVNGENKWAEGAPGQSSKQTLNQPRQNRKHDSQLEKMPLVHPKGRNRRSVWNISTKGFKGGHFAVYPPELVEVCLKAACPEVVCAKCGAPHVRVTGGYFHPSCQCREGVLKGVCLDPFLGSGTTAMVAQQWGRDWLGFELNPAYAADAILRIEQANPLKPRIVMPGVVQHSLGELLYG